MLFQISIIFLLILSTAVLARDIPVWGYRIRAEFECNGLPLIGSVQSLEEVNECSQVILHLDILDREAVLELLGPFAAWNASVEITCSQSSILFADDKKPVITVFHNCMPASSAANSSSAEEKPPPRQSDSCRKWDIVVPPSNLGPARETPVMNMGIQELSQLGEKVECQSSVSLLSDQQPRELSFSQENGNGQGEEEGQKKKDEKEDEGGEEEEEEEASPEKGSTEMEDGTVVDVPEKTDEDQPIEEESVDGATSSTGASIVDADAGE